MSTIHKFVIPTTYNSIISTSKYAQFLDAQVQNGQIAIWVLTDDGPKVDWTISLYGTGWKLPDYIDLFQYIGTVQMDQFVWHIFNGGYVNEPE